MKVAVVGAGIAGSSTARHLATRGHQVTLFERFEIGHTRGSSLGSSRIIRQAYPDALYTQYLLEGHRMWRDLEMQSGETLVDECGLLYFGSRDGEHIQSVIRSTVELDIPHSIHDRSSTRMVFEGLTLEDNEVAVFTPEAGFVDADAAVRATLRLAQEHGAVLRPNTHASREDLEADFDAFVLCAGPWVRDWVDVPVKVTLQAFAYFDIPIRGPVWIDGDGPQPYGIPNDRQGFKVGVNARLMEFDPDRADRPPPEAFLELIRAATRRRFGVREPKLLEAVGCLYTNSPNDDFLLGRIGKKGYFVSACSGHGFKFGPWIGKLLADFVAEADAPERYPRFLWQSQSA